LAAPFFQLIIGCWIRKSTFLQYSGMHGEYHLQAIEEKRARHRFLVVLFRQMAKTQPIA
jgi:hypothetical protein